jgi:hypothetical protein
MIKSHYLADNTEIGGLVKLIIYNKDTKSDTIPVTVTKKCNSRVYMYLKNVGQSTELILQNGITISAMPSSSMLINTIKTWTSVNIIYDDSRYFIAKSVSKSLIKMGFCVNIFNINKIKNGFNNSIIYSSIDSLSCKNDFFKCFQNSYYIVDVRMQCMLSGVCGKCSYIENNNVQYGCEKYIAKAAEIETNNMKNRSKYLDIL